jgi:hypothetical protein
MPDHEHELRDELARLDRITLGATCWGQATKDRAVRREEIRQQLISLSGLQKS